MSLATHELARLKTLLASVSGTAHASTALKLAKQFERPLGETEARIYDEALLHLARAEKTEARTRLSRRLAPVEIGPARTVADLAYDLDPEVAAPVLRLSVLLQDADLITIARTRSQGHLGAIAERGEVGAPVTDIVVARGSWPVLRRLAANRTAHLSGQGLARLTVLSRGDGHITVALTKRNDVPAAEKGELLAQFKQMATARRSSLRGEHSDLRLDVEASAAVPVLTTVAQVHADPLSAEELRVAGVRVDTLTRSRPLTSAEVSHALAQGGLAEAVVIIARLTSQEPAAFVEALRGLSPVRNLALLAMRSAELSWAAAERVLREVASAADHEGRPPSLNIASQWEAYVGLSCQSAQRALQAVQLRAGLTVIEGGRPESA